MDSHEIILNDRLVKPSSSSLATRDLLDIGYRRRRTFGGAFLLIMLGAVVAALVMPRRYESEIKILVHRERADPLVTAQQTAAVEQNMPSLTEEEINSEEAILRSQDLLEKVVVNCDLQHLKSHPIWDKWIAAFIPPKQQDQETSVR